jgi:hypothetical protein
MQTSPLAALLKHSILLLCGQRLFKSEQAHPRSNKVHGQVGHEAGPGM